MSDNKENNGKMLDEKNVDKKADAKVDAEAELVQDAIYDARTLGVPKMTVLGFQHMFAMFGSTVLVPALTGLSVSATLLFAGLGTLLFHLISRGKVPAFLGSSFAFLAGYYAIAPKGEKELLPYACLGVATAGLVYVILAGLIRAFGVNKVMRFFPPIVTGPIIIAIGLSLSKSAIDNCATNWLVAVIAILIVVICNIYGRGMIRIIPILCGVLGACLVAVIFALICGSSVTLSDGTEYSVQVKALGDNLHFGDSPLSAAISVTTLAEALSALQEGQSGCNKERCLGWPSGGV